MNNTTNPIALIIGGSSGMGLATAEKLLKNDIDTIIVGSSKTKLETAKQTLSSLGNIETLQANLYEISDIEKVIKFITNNDRHIGYLVNAAGKFKPTPFLEHNNNDYDTYADLNRATFFISQAVAKNMAKHKSGSIVNIGSMWAKQAIKATPSSCLA